MDKTENFLKELSNLTQKYGICIQGEGCDKPFLDDIYTGEELAYGLDYSFKDKKYSINHKIE